VKVLIKIGGTLLDDPRSRARLASEIADAVRDGLHAAVVHGGGKQMTRFLSERGIESRFVNGLRVTTPEVLDAVLKVLAGSVNQELVAAFVAAGAKAVGLTGMDAMLTEAEPLSEELGFVGKPTTSNVQLLEILIENGFFPVIACLAGDRSGHFYNVNADQMAASIAAGIQADKLLFLTDVDGVKGEDGRVIEEISPETCRELIASGVATGGMRAKLEAAAEAVRRNVSEVRIVPGALPGVIGQILGGSGLGTRLVAAIGAHCNG
jgi:acetylglutamate kinase